MKRTRITDVITKEEAKKWVSDIIGDDYKKWKNEFVVLDCGTGSGKTYFCINILGKYAEKQSKKMLYLCNRSKLRNQIYENVKDHNLRNTVYVTSYQSLQKDLQNNKDIGTYDYIVADECHYFTTDATFNDYTDISYDFIINQKKSVVLFVSATAKTFFKYLQDTKKVESKNSYRLDKDYSYVKKLFFYQADELNSIIDDILEDESDSKIVVFCNSGSRIIEMNKIYGEQADYYCSKGSRNYRLKKICGWIDEDGKQKVNTCIKQYSEDCITFDRRILFTTSVLDNGVDLKDVKIKHIFTEIIDIDTMIQSLGRKRSLKGKNDTCTFYIREYQKKGIQGFINRISSQLEPVDLYKNNYEKFYKTYGEGKERNKLKRNDVFYNFFPQRNKHGEIRLNDCKYRKYKQDFEMFSAMKEIGHKAYLGLILEKGLIDNSEDMVCDVEKLDLFIEFLKSIEGKRLYSDDQNFIKEEFETIGLKLRYKGINTFNGALEDTYKESYFCRFYNTDVEGNKYIDKRRILPDGTTNKNRDKRYWILENREPP